MRRTECPEEVEPANSIVVERTAGGPHFLIFLVSRAGARVRLKNSARQTAL